MELLIAILMYLGMLSPDVATTASSSDLDLMVQSNRQVIEQVCSDPVVVQAAGDLIIDRRED